MSTTPMVEFPFSNRQELNAYLPYLVNRISKYWTSEQGEALAKLGISNTQMRILSCLAAAGELTINELSELSVTEQSTTSRTVENLVEAGLVLRHIGDTDQRLRRVRLSAKGHKQLAAMAPTVNGLYHQFVGQIDEEALRACVETLKMILDQASGGKAPD